VDNWWLTVLLHDAYDIKNITHCAIKPKKTYTIISERKLYIGLPDIEILVRHYSDFLYANWKIISYLTLQIHNLLSHLSLNFEEKTNALHSAAHIFGALGPLGVFPLTHSRLSASWAAERSRFSHFYFADVKSTALQ